MEKTEKWHLLPNSWRYFDQNFIEMFLLFMKTSLSVKLLLPTFTFHVLIMGKIEKISISCRYFDKQNDPLFHNHWRKSYQSLLKNWGNYEHHTWGYKCPDCRLWTWTKMQVVRNDQIYNFLWKNMFKGMHAPRLSHIHVEKNTCFQITPPLIPLGPLGPYFIFNMLAKGNNKLSVFYTNP